MTERLRTTALRVPERHRHERGATTRMRALADQAFSRTAGAPLSSGNSVRVLKDAAENYPAWLDAIAGATHHVHFESYIIYDDAIGEQFADALIARARAGVRIRLLYDWLGAVGKTSRQFWKRLRAGGVDVRCHNPPRIDSPLGWLSRDHRKMLAIDGRIGFVAGLCVGRRWVGLPERNIPPWRDTGVEVRGPAVADIEQAFAQVWAMSGAPLPADEQVDRDAIPHAGGVSMRIVPTVPSTAGLLRLELLVAALARERLWLTDAYYAGTAAYVQALCAAARDGVDVRLLVPGATDLPLLRPLSRAGYRVLLEAGVRVYEWNGPMIHAKTAIADGRWARVGSTNLNISSFVGNCELDAVIEDAEIAGQMEEQYLEDLTGATEFVLDVKRNLRAPGEPRRRRGLSANGRAGRMGRAAAGAVRIGHAVGAAFTSRRPLEPIEARAVFTSGASLIALAVAVFFFPHLLLYPLMVLLAWFGVSLLCRGVALHRAHRRERLKGRDAGNDGGG